MQVLKEEIRNRIEKAALAEFFERSFKGASIRSIAAAAGISTSNLYNYYKNKRELFYALTTPTIEGLYVLIEGLRDRETENHFDEEHIELVAETLAEYIKNFRREFILIMDKSEGTKYANAKEALVTLLENISAEKLPDLLSQDTILLKIIYMNLIEGIGEILKRDMDDEWTERNVKTLIKYHKLNLVNIANIEL